MIKSNGFNDSSRSPIMERIARLSVLGFVLAISIATLAGIAKAFAVVAYNQGQIGLTLIFSAGVLVGFATIPIVVLRTTNRPTCWIIIVFAIALIWLGSSLGTAIMTLYGDLSISAGSQYAGDILTVLGIVLVLGYLGYISTGKNR